VKDEIVRKEDSPHKGAWVIERDGERLASLYYTGAPGRLILDHTEVSDALRGTGARKRLVEAAVKWARETDTTLIPLCPFAKSVFDKNPELRDVLLFQR
jgi:predicted GNAT family acetyltransferase